MIHENKTYNFNLKAARTLPIPTYWVDETGVTVACNEANLETYQLSESNYAGQTPRDFFPDDQNHALLLEKRFQSLVKNNKSYSQIDSFSLGDQKYCVLHCQFPLLNQNNRVMGLYGFCIPLITDNHVHLDEIFGTRANQFYKFLQEQHQNVIHCHPLLSELTTREKECLTYVLKGYSAKTIGKHLKIGYRTVETHLEKIKIKLGAHNKQALLELCHYNRILTR